MQLRLRAPSEECPRDVQETVVVGSGEKLFTFR